MVVVVVDTGVLLVSFEVLLDAIPSNSGPRAWRLRALPSFCCLPFCRSLSSAACFFALGFAFLFDDRLAIVLKLLCCRLYHFQFGMVCCNRLQLLLLFRRSKAIQSEKARSELE